MRKVVGGPISKLSIMVKVTTELGDGFRYNNYEFITNFKISLITYSNTYENTDGSIFFY